MTCVLSPIMFKKSRNRLKSIQYFKNKIGYCFYHLNNKVKQEWEKDFKDQVFVSHDKIGFLQRF